MKSSIVQEIIAEQQEDVVEEAKKPAHNQPPLSVSVDYPKNIENYFVLLKALYENSSLLKGIQEQSTERKENLSIDNNGNSNQPQHVPRKINISIKKEPEDGSTVGGEGRLGNIIINSLDVSINVPFNDCSHGDDANVKISCSASPKMVLEDSLEQLVTSSSSDSDLPGPGDDDQPITTSENNNLASRRINDEAARAAHCKRVKEVPDDISPDDCRTTKRHDDVDEDDDKHTSSTTSNNNSSKHSSGADDVGDYRRKNGASIDVERSNKQTGDMKPITSTYLLMTRSMGLADEDALNLVSKMMLYYRTKQDWVDGQ